MRKVSVVRNVSTITTTTTSTPDPTETRDFETAISLTGYGKFNIILMLASLPGVMANIFDTSAMSYVLPSAVCDLKLDSIDKGVLNAITYAGMICSAFLWGFLSDTLGRQKLLVVGFFLDATCGFISSLSQNFGVLVVFRFFSGFIISGPHAMLLSFLAEYHCTKYRARIIIFTGVYGALANISLPGLAWLIIPQAWSWTVFNMTFNSWRLYVALCTLPSLMAGILISFYDESPKFLLSRGHSEEALQVLRKIYAVNTGRHPDTYPVKAITFEKSQVSQKPTPPPTNTTLAKQIVDLIVSGCKQATPLFKAPHLTSAALVFSIQFGSLLSMNTIRLWMPQLFFIMEDFSKLQAASVDDHSLNSYSICEMLAYTDNIAAVAAANRSLSALSRADTCTVNAVKSTMYLNSVIVGGVTGLFYLFAGSLINALGRKRLLIIGFMISGLCAISIYWSRNTNVTIAVIATFLAASSVCGKALISVVVDLFPTSLRAMAVSMTMMFGRSGALLGNLLFPVLLDISCIIPFILVSGIVIVGGALCFMIPKHFGKNSD